MNWAPKPLRPMGTNGIFQYDEESTVVQKGANRWQQQRADDGSPYTRHGTSALVPPPAGPKLVLNDLEKSQEVEEVQKAQLDPEAVVKSFIQSAKKLGAKVGRAAVGAVTKVADIAKNAGCDDDDDSKADDLKKHK